METHVLIAHLAHGRQLEIGRVRSLECAARLLDGLRHELTYRRFEIQELDVPWPAPTATSVRFEDLQAEVRRRFPGAELLHVSRSR